VHNSKFSTGVEAPLQRVTAREVERGTFSCGNSRCYLILIDQRLSGGEPG
jgi:hypothetical protein